MDVKSLINKNVELRDKLGEFNYGENEEKKEGTKLIFRKMLEYQHNKEIITKAELFQNMMELKEELNYI